MQTVPAALLFAAIQDSGLSQAEFARRIHQSPQTLTNWKARGIPWNEIATVAAALGITVDEYVANANGRRPMGVRWALPGRGASELTAGNNREKNTLHVTSIMAHLGSVPATYSIPLLEIEGSMGGGRVQPEFETIVGKLELNQHFVRSRLPNASSPTNLRVITGYGDSMEGTYADGDPLFVDVGVTEVNVDAVYVFSLGTDLYVKRLQRRPDGTLNVISDNPKYPPYTITEREQVRVVGRVVGGFNFRKL